MIKAIGMATLLGLGIFSSCVDKDVEFTVSWDDSASHPGPLGPCTDNNEPGETLHDFSADIPEDVKDFKINSITINELTLVRDPAFTEVTGDTTATVGYVEYHLALEDGTTLISSEDPDYGCSPSSISLFDFDGAQACLDDLARGLNDAPQNQGLIKRLVDEGKVRAGGEGTCNGDAFDAKWKVEMRATANLSP